MSPSEIRALAEADRPVGAGRAAPAPSAIRP